MSSNINPNNIDGNYPVAGQPNNTQGFRDNFTNTKTNFQFASDEITDLQNKAVLKSALTGTTLDNNMNDNIIYAVQLKDVSWTELRQTATSGSITLNYSEGNYQAIPTVTNNISLGFSNWPAAGTVGSLKFAIVVSDVSYTLTLPAAVSVGVQNIKGLNTGTNIITFPATGTYVYQFETADGGSTISIEEINTPTQLQTGNILTTGGGVGYSTGAGSTVTQGTSRTTGVTIDAYSGSITLYNAAGTSSYTSFTVTNNKVAATDVIIVNQKSGTDKYETFVTAVAAGSFRITFSDTSGTTTEQPVFNFAVIKAVAS